MTSLKTVVMGGVLASAAAMSLPAAACGSDPFLGEICTFAFNFCPRGYLPTDGQVLPISTNTALFSLLGTQYGGDGRVTFGLPDLRGRAALGQGQGPGLANIDMGEAGGVEQITLNTNQIPFHNHPASTTVTATLRGTNGAGSSDAPGGKVPAKYARTNVYSSGTADVNMGASAITTTADTTIGGAGGGQPFDNRSPYLGVNYCIAVQGIYPSRN